MRISVAWQWAGAIVLGLAIGLGASLLAIGSGRGNIAAGPWVTSMVYGSSDADMYTRARVALFGLLALNKEQAVYYTASVDDAGERLSGDCTYLLKGQDLTARWWSVTAYGADSYLIANDAGIYSFSKATVAREPDGSYEVRVSAARQAGNWLPVKRGERFDLTARLYNPAAAVHADPAAVALPVIEKESCE